MRVQQRNQLLVRAVLLSLWLPAGIVLVSVVRFRGLQTFEGASDLGTLFWPLVLAWPAAIPLTLAVLRILPRSRTLAWLCAMALGPISIITVSVSGILGPAAIIITGALASLPAWLTLGLLALLSGRGPNLPVLLSRLMRRR